MAGFHVFFVFILYHAVVYFMPNSKHTGIIMGGTSHGIKGHYIIHLPLIQIPLILLLIHN